MPVTVYKATNLVNGHLYVGVTKFSLETRRRQHATAARGTKPWPFLNAIRKHGIEMFRFSEVMECEGYPDAFATEERLIDLWKPIYNATLGGEGSTYWLGKKRSPETVKKMVARKRERGWSKPTAVSISALRAAGARLAEERRRAVVRIDTGQRFNSYIEAAAAFGLVPGSVAGVASGRRKTIHGVRFAYAE